jgi:hypothetical protein
MEVAIDGRFADLKSRHQAGNGHPGTPQTTEFLLLVWTQARCSTTANPTGMGGSHTSTLSFRSVVWCQCGKER